jgi:serine/threonine protein kinase
MRERNIMAMTNNPFLVKLFYTFQSKGTLYFGMEFCQGGDLASLLQILGGFEEGMVRGYVGEMVLALEYLKSQMIVHRDLKPDNILVASDGHIKLTDFGLSYGALVEHVLGGSLELYDEMPGSKMPDGGEAAAPSDKSEKRYSEVGTPHYLAPEILTGIGHSYPVDYWALGVMMYEFFVGVPPFTGEDLSIIFQRITCCDIEWSEDLIRGEGLIPPEGRALIQSLLTIDPDLRLGSGPGGIASLKAHPFFLGVDWVTLLERPAAFVPSPDNDMDTGYFCEKSDDEGVVPEEWSCGESSESVDSTGSFKQWEEEILSPDDEDTQFLGFSFRNLDHLKGLNIGEIQRERKITCRYFSPNTVPRSIWTP